MKTTLILLTLLTLTLGLPACQSFQGQTLSRQPQSTQTGSMDSGQVPQGQDEPLEPSPEDEMTLVEIADDQSPAPEAFTLVVPHPSQGDLQTVLAQHAEQAYAMGRYPFIEFSAEWCPPCQAIENYLGDPMMVNAFQGTYLIRVDIDEWGDQITRIGFLVPGIPLFYELNQDGASTGRAIAGSAWGVDVPQNMAPPLSAFFQANQ